MRLTCKEASRLISEGLDRSLTLGDRAKLRLHLVVCDACTRLKSQFEFLRRAVSTYADKDADEKEAGKSRPPRD